MSTLCKDFEQLYSSNTVCIIEQDKAAVRICGGLSPRLLWAYWVAHLIMHATRYIRHERRPFYNQLRVNARSTGSAETTGRQRALSLSWKI